METWASTGQVTQEWTAERYTRQDYLNYEEALLWNEANYREPNFTFLAAKLPSYADRQSPRNLQNMRVFTTLSLTHSDGYINVHQSLSGSLYYDFWDAPLGRPIGEKGQRYRGQDGLFIREFTNGWVVYNRSGAPQSVRFNEKVSGVESGLTHTIHILGDLDGEIYLKASLSADVNGDGIVSILDLVAIAQAFGEKSPDVNGDGIVNILDLIAVSGQIK